METKQYLEISRERYTQQFKYKRNFDKLMATWLQDASALQESLLATARISDIETATGVNLDNIGEIVGQDRKLLGAELRVFFGFQAALGARSYGSLDDSSAGGRWKDIGEALKGNVKLSDNEYRIFIKSKILRNVTDGTTEDIIKAVQILFEVDKVQLNITEGMASFIVAIGRLLSEQEKLLITYSVTDPVKRYLIPKPAGVLIGFQEFDGDNAFAYQGAPDAKGYGDLNDPSVGGRYSSLIIV